MKILILGGTVFLGRALVDAAKEEGHHVTILSRGRSGWDPEGVRAVRGDRDDEDGLLGLGTESFDVVLDTSRQAVGQVRRAVDVLRRRAGRYVYISTVSVYGDFSDTGMTEESPTFDALWPATAEEEGDPRNYPALNVACEQVLMEGMGDRALVVRPGLIVGEHDPTDRFGYWPARIIRGGDVLAPGTPDRPVQFIDVRDLAEFIVRAAAGGRSGVYNACGPGGLTTMGDFLGACVQHIGARAELIWVDDAFLVEHDVQPYLGLPLWLPAAPAWTVDTSKAIEAGLTHRAITESIDAALATERRLGLHRERRAGLSPAEEAGLLRQWRRAAR